MAEVAWATGFLLMMVGASAAGLWLQDRLKEHHKSKDTVEAIRMVVAMVVTFSALVLGLLVTSVKADFDDHTDLYRKYGISLSELDQRFVEYGPAADPLRQLLRSYTAAVYVLTWPDEPAPSGSYPKNLKPVAPGSDEMAELSALMWRIDDGIRHLDPTDPFHQSVAVVLQDDVRAMESDRWTVVERSQSRLSPIFVGVLVSWMLIVFFIFGVVSPRNSLTVLVLALSAFSVASSLYLTLDLDTSLGGFIKVPSRPFQDALWHMDQRHGP